MEEQGKQNQKLITIPTMSATLDSPELIRELIKNDFSFVALDNPELSKTISNAFRILSAEVIRVKFHQFGADNLKKGSQARKKKSENYIKKIKPLLQVIQNKGIITQKATVKELNRQEYPTPTGKKPWKIHTLRQVYKVIKKNTP